MRNLSHTSACYCASVVDPKYLSLVRELLDVPLCFYTKVVMSSETLILDTILFIFSSVHLILLGSHSSV